MLLLLLFLCILLTNAFILPSYYHQPSLSRVHILKSSRDNDNNVQKEEEEEEWRAFRARLVQNGLPSLDNTSKSCNDTQQQQYAHITTPLVEIGSILLSIPTKDICQGYVCFVDVYMMCSDVLLMCI